MGLPQWLKDCNVPGNMIESICPECMHRKDCLALLEESSDSLRVALAGLEERKAGN